MKSSELEGKIYITGKVDTESPVSVVLKIVAAVALLKYVFFAW